VLGDMTLEKLLQYKKALNLTIARNSDNEFEMTVPGTDTPQ